VELCGPVWPPSVHVLRTASSVYNTDTMLCELPCLTRRRVRHFELAIRHRCPRMSIYPSPELVLKHLTLQKLEPVDPPTKALIIKDGASQLVQL
jgi:hypothetical protein